MLRAKQHEKPTNQANELFDHIADLLWQCWADTGFGRFEVKSELIRSNLVRVIVDGTVSHRFVIDLEDPNPDET